jgi:uncharacterized membrane protein
MVESIRHFMSALVTGTAAVTVAGVYYGAAAATIVMMVLVSVMLLLSAFFHRNVEREKNENSTPPSRP